MVMVHRLLCLLTAMLNKLATMTIPMLQLRLPSTATLGKFCIIVSALPFPSDARSVLSGGTAATDAAIILADELLKEYERAVAEEQEQRKKQAEQQATRAEAEVREAAEDEDFPMGFDDEGSMDKATTPVSKISHKSSRATPSSAEPASQLMSPPPLSPQKQQQPSTVGHLDLAETLRPEDECTGDENSVLSNATVAEAAEAFVGRIEKRSQSHSIDLMALAVIVEGSNSIAEADKREIMAKARLRAQAIHLSCSDLPERFEFVPESEMLPAINCDVSVFWGDMWQRGVVINTDTATSNIKVSIGGAKPTWVPFECISRSETPSHTPVNVELAKNGDGFQYFHAEENQRNKWQNDIKATSLGNKSDSSTTRFFPWDLYQSEDDFMFSEAEAIYMAERYMDLSAVPEDEHEEKQEQFVSFLQDGALKGKTKYSWDDSFTTAIEPFLKQYPLFASTQTGVIKRLKLCQFPAYVALLECGKNNIINARKRLDAAGKQDDKIDLQGLLVERKDWASQYVYSAIWDTLRCIKKDAAKGEIRSKLTDSPYLSSKYLTPSSSTFKRFLAEFADVGIDMSSKAGWRSAFCDGKKALYDIVLEIASVLNQHSAGSLDHDAERNAASNLGVSEEELCRILRHSSPFKAISLFQMHGRARDQTQRCLQFSIADELFELSKGYGRSLEGNIKKMHWADDINDKEEWIRYLLDLRADVRVSFFKSYVAFLLRKCRTDPWDGVEPIHLWAEKARWVAEAYRMLMHESENLCTMTFL